LSSPGTVNSLKEITLGRFSEIQSLNISQTLFLFTYNAQILEDYKAIDLLRKLPNYLLHQEDLEIKPRATLPNDTLYPRQWHLPKIMANEAWDLNRRGVNRNGDTIVIAVIDDGLHLNHPDFKGNIWINYADSLGNGIDDDSNGFVDDHFGWNFMSNNNDISDSSLYKAGHGTPVAGIIGARGNNITGVTGIMWNVKLMIVNIADSGWYNLRIFESDALRAYDYVLHQRKLYNSSQGKKGAFVVASNSSWGVDFKFPHQAPLWCGMYDSLGKYGILNVSAVTNVQDDEKTVDVTGDLPTLCPSEHLITVSSSGKSDNFFSSGRSDISIDLSAPGANIFSTAAYTKFYIDRNLVYKDANNGTSFASPMVTGCVGLLHSYACERILDTIRTNPAKGNLILRKCILEGVDKIDALSGKSITGGRLNIKKAMEIMDQYCLGNVGVDETGFNDYLLVFPNPGTGIVEFLSDLQIDRVECFDLNGRVQSCDFNGTYADISLLAAGSYYFSVTCGSRVFQIKYLKIN
jgi:hypothetical protein